MCRYSSRPPNGWNNLMKIRQGSRLERAEHEEEKEVSGEKQRRGDEPKGDQL